MLRKLLILATTANSQNFLRKILGSFENVVPDL